MKTYYDVLEISRHASKEVLERAHKILIKRYHPDLETDPVKRKEKEEYIKKINEAYEILSDDNKRKEYDLKVFREEVQTDNLKNDSEDEIIDEKKADKLEEDRINNEYIKIVDEEIKKAQERIDEEERLIKENLRRHERAYLRSLGYNIKEPVNWKRRIILIITTIAFLVLIWLIYLIPSVRIAIDTEIEKNTVWGFILSMIKYLYTLVGTVFREIFKTKK